MVSTRARGAPTVDEPPVKAKVTKKVDGIKAPAKRPGRPKKTETAPTAQEEIVQEPAVAEAPAAKTRNTRSKPVTISEGVEPVPKPTKSSAKATAKTTAKTLTKAAASKTRATKKEVPVEIEAPEETQSRATRDTASTKARQNATSKDVEVKQTKAKSTKVAAQKKEPQSKTVAKPRATRKAKTVVETPIKEAEFEEEIINHEEIDEEDGCVQVDTDVNTASEDQTTHQDAPETVDQIMHDTIEQEQRPPSPVKVKTPGVLARSTNLKRKRDESPPPLPQSQIPLRVTADSLEDVTPPESDEPASDQTIAMSPMRCSSVLQPGQSLGSPRRPVVAAPKLMLTPAKNRFGDWLKSSVTANETSTHKMLPSLATPPTSFNATLKASRTINISPTRNIIPPQSCMRGTKRRASGSPEDDATGSPKKIVSFTVQEAAVKTPKTEPTYMPADDVTMNLGDPFTFSVTTPAITAVLPAASTAKKTPRMGLFTTTSSRPTSRMNTPHNLKSKLARLATPGTVHWTWNPITPAPALPVVSPLRKASSTDDFEFSSPHSAPMPEKDTVLKGVKCYVEVRWPDGSDGSKYFAPLLKDLGAEVSVNFTDDVSHVLWGNGNLITLERVAASNGGIKAVNLSWPMDCEKASAHLEETLYLVDFKIYGVRNPNVIATPKTVIRTPGHHSRALSVLDVNSTPTKTPATMKHGAKRIKLSPTKGSNGALLIKTPAFKASQIGVRPFGLGQENAGMATPETVMQEKLLQRTCPAKQDLKPLVFLGQESPLKRRTALKRRLSQS